MGVVFDNVFWDVSLSVRGWNHPDAVHWDVSLEMKARTRTWYWLNRSWKTWLKLHVCPAVSSEQPTTRIHELLLTSERKQRKENRESTCFRPWNRQVSRLTHPDITSTNMNQQLLWKESTNSTIRHSCDGRPTYWRFSWQKQRFMTLQELLI